MGLGPRSKIRQVRRWSEDAAVQVILDLRPVFLAFAQYSFVLISLSSQSCRRQRCNRQTLSTTRMLPRIQISSRRAEGQPVRPSLAFRMTRMLIISRHCLSTAAVKSLAVCRPGVDIASILTHLLDLFSRQRPSSLSSSQSP